LCDKIAGIAGEHDVIYLTLSTFRKVDHFADVSKMIGNGVTSVLAGFFCLGDHVSKVLPKFVTEKML